jgi:hypothetical protein
MMVPWNRYDWEEQLAGSPIGLEVPRPRWGRRTDRGKLGWVRGMQHRANPPACQLGIRFAPVKAAMKN